MPSLTKTLVCLAVSANAFLAPAPQRPATVLQAATIAAKDVSALRKASGTNRCKKCNKNGAFKLVALGRASLSGRATRHRDAVDATARHRDATDAAVACREGGTTAKRRPPLTPRQKTQAPA